MRFPSLSAGCRYQRRRTGSGTQSFETNFLLGRAGRPETGIPGGQASAVADRHDLHRRWVILRIPCRNRETGTAMGAEGRAGMDVQDDPAT